MLLRRKSYVKRFAVFWLINGPNIMGDELLLNFGAKFQR